MQKKILAAAVAALCGVTTTTAVAQSNESKVQLWGIADAAIRHTNNEGANKGGLTKMLGGGMSQSRWGIKVEEDLGGGSKALVELENRFTLDNGETPVGATPFFQLAYVGLQGPYGRLTMGRQWNVLFDVVSSTYASFPYSPYMEAYKPELGMAVAARSSNTLKYLLATPDRKFVGALQYSFGEGAKVNPATSFSAMQNAGLDASGMGQNIASTLPGALLSQNWAKHVSSVASSIKQVGGFARYSSDGISAGGGYLKSTLPGGSKLDAWTLGGSYRKDKIYLNIGYGENKFKLTNQKGGQGPGGAIPVTQLVDLSILSDLWGGQTNGGFQPGMLSGALSPINANKRKMYKIGFGYQITPSINVGAHYYHAKQSGSVDGSYNGKADFLVAALNYTFSKRTDAYFAVDHTKLNGGSGMALQNKNQTGGVNVTKRTGVTIGLRHRF